MKFGDTDCSNAANIARIVFKSLAHERHHVLKQIRDSAKTLSAGESESVLAKWRTLVRQWSEEQDHG